VLPMHRLISGWGWIGVRLGFDLSSFRNIRRSIFTLGSRQEFVLMAEAALFSKGLNLVLLPTQILFSPKDANYSALRCSEASFTVKECGPDNRKPTLDLS